MDAKTTLPPAYEAGVYEQRDRGEVPIRWSRHRIAEAALVITSHAPILDARDGVTRVMRGYAAWLEIESPARGWAYPAVDHDD